jgi:hypothetical protein
VPSQWLIKQQLFFTGAGPNPGLATLLGEPSQRRWQLHKALLVIMYLEISKVSK